MTEPDTIQVSIYNLQLDQPDLKDNIDDHLSYSETEDGPTMESFTSTIVATIFLRLHCFQCFIRQLSRKSVTSISWEIVNLWKSFYKPRRTGNPHFLC